MATFEKDYVETYKHVWEHSENQVKISVFVHPLDNEKKWTRGKNVIKPWKWNTIFETQRLRSLKYNEKS